MSPLSGACPAPLYCPSHRPRCARSPHLRLLICLCMLLGDTVIQLCSSCSFFDYYPPPPSLPACLPACLLNRGSKLHTCRKCGGAADQASKDAELVPCRRCPLAYHRRCLPDNLPLERHREPGKRPRVWLADYDEKQGERADKHCLPCCLLGAGRWLCTVGCSLKRRLSPAIANLQCLSAVFLSLTCLRAAAASAAGVWLDGVEQSLLYCRRHPLGDNGQALFNLPPPPGKKQQQREVQQYRLIRGELLKAALLHYAKQYRHLESSRKLLAKVR